MAKRSPILGYNHNVRYRGLVFHVQTEDSGVLSPHLFTHLFFTGVIISTRKLVYDSGSGEESIKSLMQAQHKAVLKDLRRGVFDDKIDEYLGGTPGLLPRGTVEEADRASDPVLERPSGPQVAIAPVVKRSDAAFDALVELESGSRRTDDGGTTRRGGDDSGTTRRDDNRHDPTIPDVRRMTPHAVQPPAARTQTAERRSAPTAIRTNLPPPPGDDIDGPTSSDPMGAVAAAVAAANSATTRTVMPVMPREEASPIARDFADSAPEIQIELELDEPDELPRTRTSRDTDIEMAVLIDEHTRPTIDVSSLSDGIPAGPTIKIRTPGESIPPLPPPPASERRASSSVGAASLPPARPITRPPARPAITPPQVLSRPLTADDARRRAGESDAVEVYAPAPPSADSPPGLERPGVYSQHKKISARIPVLPDRERSGSIPPGLGRPGRISQPPTGPVPRAQVSPPSSPIPQAIRPEPSPSTPTLPRARTPTPSRSSPPAARPGSGGVVMTRPAVIVGAPAKPAATPRVRKAREDEGRGFGQGLISEKSLDEVILAYLSEDADEK